MAADFKVEVDLRKLSALIQQEPQKSERWLAGFAEDMVTDIKTSFGTSPPGRTHTRGGVTHVASLPGYPPNIDTGALIGSIRQVEAGKLTRRIEDGVEYGRELEEGIGMEPRPFMDPAFDRARKRIEQDAADNLGLESV
jgi:hypothetical protein